MTVRKVIHQSPYHAKFLPGWIVDAGEIDYKVIINSKGAYKCGCDQHLCVHIKAVKKFQKEEK